MSRCIVVLSVGRSGSSALSGMLHKLGVNMGKEFIEASWKNPWGTYEDLEFYLLNRRVIDGESMPSDYADFVARRDERAGPVWGVKDPAFGQLFHFMLPYLDDVRVITISRDFEETVNSFNSVELMGINAARGWVKKLQDKQEEQLKAFDGPVLSLSWNDVKADPAGTARQLVDFCYEGLEPLARPELYIKNAAEHIRAKPEKDGGFGNIAIGARIGSHPEADFFVSWTGMLTAGNLRKGDTILAPECHQPAHWAATKLARAFLKSGRDTLLLVDDDMLFPPDALEKMRSREENWSYDVVSCLATHRVWPPKPIVFKLKDQSQISEPEKLKGDHYDLYYDFEKGDIEPVDAFGLAFTLIRREVFIAMLHPDYGVEYTWFFTYGRGWESDDIPFSRHCRELGFKSVVDTNTDIYHIGRRAFGYEHFLAWKGSQANTQPGHVDFNAEDLIPILREAANARNGYSEKATMLLKAIQNAAE